MTDIRPLGSKPAATLPEVSPLAKAVSESGSKRVEASTHSQPAIDESGGTAIQEALTKINDFVQSLHRDLNFTVDNSSGKTVVKVLDAKTQELIRQIPNETALRIAKNLDRSSKALGLVNERI